jgi:hypothetical protein
VLAGLLTGGVAPAHADATETNERDLVENANATGINLAYATSHEQFYFALQISHNLLPY